MLSVQNNMDDAIGANLAGSKKPMGGQRDTNKSNNNWDLPIFALGKWNLGDWNWESQTQN